MYPVDLHMHTVASTHAYSNLHDYIAQAKLKDIRLFAITDHGPDMADAPHYWHFVNMRIWPRLVDGIGILRGIEANIKNTDGEIDCTGPMLTSLDLILAGFHEPVFAPQDKETNTAAMIATIASGNVHIISHPATRSTQSIFRLSRRRQRRITWRWRLTTPPSCTRVRAVKRTAAKWRPQCVMQEAWWRWVQIPILRSHWVISASA
ncbi:PHP family protein [Enterobacter cloacae]|uniref:PHP family protein n=1 Tax=Enterobacter cloacae TaxID=550 RepID=A0A377M3U4_ENTCL|nr:PHP family protein [Enterobacter cloacae]